LSGKGRVVDFYSSETRGETAQGGGGNAAPLFQSASLQGRREKEKDFCGILTPLLRKRGEERIWSEAVLFRRARKGKKGGKNSRRPLLLSPFVTDEGSIERGEIRSSLRLPTIRKKREGVFGDFT